jgi:hypothetical protein
VRFALVIAFLLLVAPVWGSTDIDTLGDFMQEVRWMVNCADDDMLPDSVLIGLSKRALLWTSTDVGGIEATYLVETVKNQQFYEMPDSITQILFATTVNGNYTFSIKSITPAYFEDVYMLQSLTEGEDQVPQAYNYWSDTMQFLPTPIKVDSVYFKCYIEHPYVDSKDDSVQLRSPFIEPALEYCCYLVYKRWQELATAGTYMASYDALRAKLIARYTRQIELPPGQ